MPKNFYYFLNRWNLFLNLNKMFHLPRAEGRFGKVNPEGIEFYNELIDSLLLKGVYLL
jgi:hypothetical protein